MGKRYFLSPILLALGFHLSGASPTKASVAMGHSAITTQSTKFIKVHRNENRNINRKVNEYGGHRSYRSGSWSRPRSYWWPIGGAVAAGAALGVIFAQFAVWAGPPPGPGYCWYYTDPSLREGFWDICP